MAKKLKKKQRKPMSLKTRNTIANGFKSILSNQAAIDGAKEGPWWLAVIFFLFSLIIPLIPIYVNLTKVYGSQFISGATYGFDRGIALATEHFKDNLNAFVVSDENVMSFYKHQDVLFEESDYVNKVDPNIPAQFSDTHKYIEVVDGKDVKYEVYTFRFYITSLEGDDLSAFVNKLDKTVYEKGTLNMLNSDDPDYSDKVAAGYTPSFIVLQKQTMAAALYKYQTTTRAANSNGGLNWAHLPGDLIARALSDVEGVIDVITNPAQQKKIFENWKNIFNDAYLDQKNATKWNTTGIYLGVYGGLMIFLGLMVFLLTRGKNNVFHYLNIWTCQKIAYWLSPTPAILGLILGFIMSGNAIGQMGFIMLISLRVMWASMKQLRPIQ